MSKTSNGILLFEQEAGLPRFFFHLILDDETLADEDGSEMESLADAMSEARAIIRELASDLDHTGRAFPLRFVRITNEEGDVFHEVSSAEIFEKIFYRKASNCPI